MRAFCALIVCSGAGAAREARADNANSASNEAQELFESARGLIGQGRFREACPKLELSQALDPGIGTMFNLARCYELSGRFASAYVAYQRSIAQMHAAGQTSRETIAQGLASAIEPRVAHVKLAVHLERIEPGLELHLDGARVEREAWSAAIPVDAGDHVVSASAPASKPWQRAFTIDHDAQTVTLDVPPLVPVAAVTATSPLPAQVLDRGIPSARGRSQRTLAAVGAALGLGAVGVGSYFGLRSMSLASQATPLCDGIWCDERGYSLRTDARSAGNASTIAFGTGIAFVAAAAILWLTAPADSPSR